MQSTLGTYTSNRSIGPVGKVKISKPIARAAAVIGLMQFLLGVGLLAAGTILYTKDVDDDIDVDKDPKLYGLWCAPGPLVVSVVGVVAWLMRKKDWIIFFAVINALNCCLCIAQAAFVLPKAFWFKDFLTLSKCREQDLDGHGLEYNRPGEDSHERDCDDMNLIAKLFILLAVCCCFAIVISIGGVIDGILGVIKMKKDQIDQMDGITNEEFRQMEQKTAMWLEQNVRFSTGSTIARSEKAVSESGFSTGTATSPGYRDKSWV